MKRGWFLLLSLSIGLNAGLLFVTLARTQSPTPLARRGGGPEEGRPPSQDHLLREHLDKMASNLGLSAAQRVSLKAVHDSLFPQIVSRSRDLEEARRDLAGEFGSSRMSPDRVRECARRVNGAQAMLDSLVAETMLAEAALLTPDQRQRYSLEMPWGRRPLPPPRR